MDAAVHSGFSWGYVVENSLCACAAMLLRLLPRVERVYFALRDAYEPFKLVEKLKFGGRAHNVLGRFETIRQRVA